MIHKTTLKIETQLLKSLKKMAIDKDLTQNDLIIEYISKGLDEDKQKS